MGRSEIRRTNDKIVESHLDNVGQAKSQDSGSKSLFEKAKQYLGPASAAALVLYGVSRRGGVEGSTPEASSTALALRGDNAMGLPPAFIPDQRAEIIGRSSTEPYVPAPRPEWLAPTHVQKTLDEVLPGLSKMIDEWSREDEEASKISHQGEAQETYDGETSSEQAKPDKHKSRKHLSSREQKIAARRALRDKNKDNLEILKKRPNDKKVRERSLLESNSENARQLQEQSGYTYKQLTSTEAQAQLLRLLAFQEAAQSIADISSCYQQPDWNNVYAYKSSSTTENGIVVMYPKPEPSGYNSDSGECFLVIDNLSAGNDAIGLVGQWSTTYYEEELYLAGTDWYTPQGVFIAASELLTDGTCIQTMYLKAIAIWENSKFLMSALSSAQIQDF